MPKTTKKTATLTAPVVKTAPKGKGKGKGKPTVAPVVKTEKNKPRRAKPVDLSVAAAPLKLSSSPTRVGLPAPVPPCSATRCPRCGGGAGTTGGRWRKRWNFVTRPVWPG